MGHKHSKKAKKSESENTTKKEESKNSGKKLTELQDPSTIDNYEPYALLELHDERIIYFTLKGYKIIVMTINLNGYEEDIVFETKNGPVESIIELKNNNVVYGTNGGLIEIIALQKNSFKSIQRILDEEDGITRLVELNDLNFVAITKNNNIILYELSKGIYESTKKINYKSEKIYFTSGIESSINNNLLVTSPTIFFFVDVYKKKILKEIIANTDKKNDNYERRDISVFTENCLRYNDTIIVAGIGQLFLIDCVKQAIIKKVKIIDNAFPCCTLTRFVGDSFVTGSGFGEMVQYKLNKKGNDLDFISKGALYLDRVTTNVYSKCGRFLIGEYNGLVILSFY